MYQYPRRLTRWLYALGAVLLVMNLAEYALEWARAIYATMYPRLSLPDILFLEPQQNVVRQLLVSHLGLLVTLIAVRALFFLAPKIDLRDDGLEFQTQVGKIFVPFSSMQEVDSVGMPGGRFFVWVHSKKGLPLQGAIASLLFGRFLWRGFLLTSDLEGFDDIMAAIVERLRIRYGEEGFAEHWHEPAPTLQTRMLSDPNQTIHDAVTAEEPPFDIRQAGWVMVWTALVLMLPLIVGGFIRLQIPWSVVVVVILGVLEWPLISAYLSILPLGETHRMEFESALLVYPLTQMSRWVAGPLLALLVAAGVPGSILLLAALPAVALCSYPVLRLTEHWFEITRPESMLGVIATVIYQMVMYMIILLLVPR